MPHHAATLHVAIQAVAMQAGMSRAVQIVVDVDAAAAEIAIVESVAGLTALPPIVAEAPRIVDAPPVAPRETSEATELGEGAPGADGNRRWRGRRGRRRGRGNSGQPGEPIAAASANTYAAPLLPEEDPNFDPDAYLPEPVVAASEPPVVTSAPQQEPSSDRGRRDDGRGGRQRSDSPRRDSGQRAPRGFTPSRDLYGVESGESSSTGPVYDAYPDADAAPSEPIILPGESLSKYRKGDDQPAPAAAASTPANVTTVTLAPPANLYTLAEGWDGGSVLPGETLSRRRPESSQEARGSQRGSERGSQRGPERESRRERGGRDNRADFRNPSAIAEPAAQAAEEQPTVVPNMEPVAEPAPTVAPTDAMPVPEQLEAHPASIPVLEPEHETPVVAALDPAPPAQFEAEPEYEPRDGSASYRVDPVSVSEYRQSGATLEHPAEAAEELVELAENEVELSEAHSITPAPANPWLSCIPRLAQRLAPKRSSRSFQRTTSLPLPPPAT